MNLGNLVTDSYLFISNRDSQVDPNHLGHLAPFIFPNTLTDTKVTKVLKTLQPFCALIREGPSNSDLFSVSFRNSLKEFIKIELSRTDLMLLVEGAFISTFSSIEPRAPYFYILNFHPSKVSKIAICTFLKFQPVGSAILREASKENCVCLSIRRVRNIEHYLYTKEEFDQRGGVVGVYKKLHITRMFYDND